MSLAVVAAGNAETLGHVKARSKLSAFAKARELQHIPKDKAPPADVYTVGLPTPMAAAAWPPLAPTQATLWHELPAMQAQFVKEAWRA